MKIGYRNEKIEQVANLETLPVGFRFTSCLVWAKMEDQLTKNRHITLNSYSHIKVAALIFLFSLLPILLSSCIIV
jgi:hypothetical protein